MIQKEKVYLAVQKIPKGKVASYKQIAKLSGVSNPRNVGYVLHLNPNPMLTPCHRVVHADGTLPDGYAFGGKHVQKEKLQSEGVEFISELKVKKVSFWT